MRVGEIVVGLWSDNEIDGSLMVGLLGCQWIRSLGFEEFGVGWVIEIIEMMENNKEGAQIF